MNILFRDWLLSLYARWVVYWRSSQGLTAAPLSEEHPPQRSQLIARFCELQAQSVAETAARTQKMQRLETCLQEAHARVVKLGAELETLHVQRMAHSLEVGRALDQLTTQLAACCPVAGENFLREINEEIEHWRRIPSMELRVRDRLSALMRAREEGETLRGAPLPVADILNAIDRLKRNLPTLSPELMRPLKCGPSQGGRTWN